MTFVTNRKKHMLRLISNQKIGKSEYKSKKQKFDIYAQNSNFSEIYNFQANLSEYKYY